MELNRKLYFVIPVEVSDTKTVYVHCAPILYETFQQYYRPLCRVFNRILSDGIGDIAGPGVASFMLEEEAKAMNMWDGADGVKKGLIEEMYRLANVIQPSGKGWEAIPYAEGRGSLSEDDQRSVEHLLTFFTVVSAVAEKAKRKIHLEVASLIWTVRVESLDATAFIAGLQTSTKDEPSATDEKATTRPAFSPSSIPG
jgi:hypothetical protein